MKNCILVILMLILCNNAYGGVLDKVVDGIPSFIGIAKKGGGSVLNKIEKKILSKCTKTYTAGRTVFKNDNIFNKESKDALGRTNCQRMQSGMAPIGHDGEPINLHHLQQENDGDIVEMLASEHRYYSKELHSHKKISEIDRQEFNEWKRRYWYERSLKICR